MSLVRTALLIALLAAVPSPPAQSPLALAPAPSGPTSSSSTQPVPTLHVPSRLVVLDVLVTDGQGHPVEGLKQSDFRLTENGIPQTLFSFSEHGNASAPPAASPQPALAPNTFATQATVPDDAPRTLIVLDNIHYPNDPYVRSDILAFMKTLAPGNPIAIVRLDWQGLHLVQDFTSDPQTLQDVVAGSRMLPPPPPLNVFPWDNCQLPYKGVINPYQRLARYIAGMPGRINLAWVTDEGTPDLRLLHSFESDYPSLASFVGTQYAFTTDLHLSRVVPYLIKAHGYIGGILQPINNLAAKATLPQIIPNPHGETPPDCPLMPPAQGGLLDNGILADKATELGGHAFFDGTTNALAQIVALGVHYYELSYVPTNPNWNGAYRKIAINVSGIPQAPPSRFGWTDYGQPKVVYRSGYYARSKPDPKSEASAKTFGPDVASSPQRRLVPVASPGASPGSAFAMATAMGFGTIPSHQIGFTIAVTPSPQIDTPKSGAALPKGNFLTDPFRNASHHSYQVHYQIDPKGLNFARTANGSYRDDLQFVAIVYRDDGLVANSVSVAAHIQVPADSLDKVMATGVTFDQAIAIPVASNPLPENFFLRVGVGETSTNHVGALEIPAESITLPPAPPLHPSPPSPNRPSSHPPPTAP